MTNQVTVTVGTPSSNGYDWTYTTSQMTREEYEETRANLRGTMCSVNGDDEVEEEAKRLARKNRNK